MKGDIPLMVVFSQQYKIKELKMLNFVRNSLKVYALVDITIIDGKYISHIV